MRHILLGVNIDHVATLRQARGEDFPSPIQAAKIALASGADSITAHLREDRRHIQDDDIYDLKAVDGLILNMEMAATDEMTEIACDIKPTYCCLVPEKRQEVTTEGGLDVKANERKLSKICKELQSFGIKVSLFIGADLKQIKLAQEIGAEIIEIHTGHYAHNVGMIDDELYRIQKAAEYAHQLGLQVNAGHGLNIKNVSAIAAIPQIIELNIGHSIIARSIFIGLEAAVKEIKHYIQQARQ